MVPGKKKIKQRLHESYLAFEDAVIQDLEANFEEIWSSSSL
jgi:hypothetical protein